MNYKNILLCIALASPLCTIGMERQAFKRSFESSQEEEWSSDQENASEKKSRTDESSYTFFMEQISQQMKNVNLASAEIDQSEGNDNNTKRSREHENHPIDTLLKKNKHEEGNQEFHAFDTSSSIHTMRIEIFEQLNRINRDIAHNQTLGYTNPFEQYLSFVDHLLKMCDQFIPGYTQKYGYSPLHIAAALGHLPIVKFLIEQRHINPDIRTTRGRTALSLAEDNKHAHVADYLFPLIYDFLYE